MAYLLDTNVVSELRKTEPTPAVLAWYRNQRSDEAFISTLVVGELRQGVERVRGRDPKQAVALLRWLVGLVSTYGDRILAVSVDIAEEWGRLNASRNRPPVIDGLMAATAKVHRLTLVTRNVDDVAATGVPIINPFESAR